MFFKKPDPLNINPFQSFWMAGYECTDQQNCFGNRVDFLSVTGHYEKIEEDYRLLSNFDIATVREGIRWSQVEKTPYQYDWSSVKKMMEAGKENGIQQIWDICHFGFPDDITPLHPMFARRFSELCRSFVRFYRSIDPDGTLIVTPFNEVSFLSWLGGDVGGTSPYCTRQGWEVKYRLMKAYIEGIETLKQEDTAIRIMVTEPLVNMVSRFDATPEQMIDAARMHESQFQVLDMLSGKICPELRGKPEYIDIVGCNYYYNNQWIAGTGEFLPWLNDHSDPRWLPLSNLINQLYQRYKRPIVLSETSHPLEDRPLWLKFVTDECCAVIEQGIPLWGVCWYPAIDRPDWDHLQPWHHAGLWDVDINDGKLSRILHEPTAVALISAQAKIKSYLSRYEPAIKSPFDWFRSIFTAN
jgi:hypothetical protein